MLHGGKYAKNWLQSKTLNCVDIIILTENIHIKVILRLKWRLVIFSLVYIFILLPCCL